MSRTVLRSVLVSVGLAACLSLSACTNAPLDTVPSVDLARFQGQWFEIAKLPRITQADCHGTTATYHLTSPTTLDLLHQCHLGSLKGELRESAAHAIVNDLNASAKLSVDFGGVYGDYWVLDLGEHYDFAVVGHPNREYLWLIARTPTVDKTTLARMLKTAQDKGFDTAKLEYTEQQAP
jgi:apolipoprotein D and lipocalin family protein